MALATVSIHQQQLQLMVVDLHNMPMIDGVMMITIMMSVTGTMGLVVVTTLTQIIAQIVNVLNQMLELTFMKSLLE